MIFRGVRQMRFRRGLAADPVAPACVVLLSMLCTASMCGNASAASALTGHEVAQQIVQAARNGLNPVPLAFFGSKVCISPEGGTAYGVAKALFPDDEPDFVESDASEGVWIMVVVGADANRIEALAIDQRTLRWDAPEDVPVARLTRCVSAIEVDLSAVPPRVSEFQP